MSRNILQPLFYQMKDSEFFAIDPKNVWATLCLKPFRRNFFKNQVYEVVMTGEGIVMVLKSKI